MEWEFDELTIFFIDSLQKQISLEFQRSLSSKAEFEEEKKLADSALNELMGILSNIQKGRAFSPFK